MMGSNLNPVEAGFLAKAVTSLEQVDIMETNITKQNKKELLTVVSTEDSRLKN